MTNIRHHSKTKLINEIFILEINKLTYTFKNIFWTCDTTILLSMSYTFQRKWLEEKHKSCP